MMHWIAEATIDGAAYLTAAAAVLTALGALVRARAKGTKSVQFEARLHDLDKRVAVLEAK